MPGSPPHQVEERPVPRAAPRCPPERACVFVRTGARPRRGRSVSNHLVRARPPAPDGVRAAVAITYAGPVGRGCRPTAHPAARCPGGARHHPPARGVRPCARSLRRAASRACDLCWVDAFPVRDGRGRTVRRAGHGRGVRRMDRCVGRGRRRPWGCCAESGEVVARFDADALYDYRARRPVLDVVDGTLARLEWPELTVRSVEAGGPAPPDRDGPRARLSLATAGDRRARPLLAGGRRRNG